MNLNQLLNLSSQSNQYIKQGITEDRLKQNIEELKRLIAFFRWYPDIFIDFIKGPDCNFEFLFYQRINKIVP